MPLSEAEPSPPLAKRSKHLPTDSYNPSAEELKGCISQTQLECNTFYSLDIPCDLWTERKQAFESTISTLEKLPIVDKERVISSLVKEKEENAGRAQQLASVTFYMSHEVSTLMVYMSFEKASTPKAQFCKFMRGLSNHLKSVMVQYLIENDLPFTTEFMWFLFENPPST